MNGGGGGVVEVYECKSNIEHINAIFGTTKEGPKHNTYLF